MPQVCAVIDGKAFEASSLFREGTAYQECLLLYTNMRFSSTVYVRSESNENGASLKPKRRDQMLDDDILQSVCFHSNSLYIL